MPLPVNADGTLPMLRDERNHSYLDPALRAR
jgi:hypothetical protein